MESNDQRSNELSRLVDLEELPDAPPPSTPTYTPALPPTSTAPASDGRVPAGSYGWPIPDLSAMIDEFAMPSSSTTFRDMPQATHGFSNPSYASGFTHGAQWPQDVYNPPPTLPYQHSYTEPPPTYNPECPPYLPLSRLYLSTNQPNYPPPVTNTPQPYQSPYPPHLINPQQPYHSPFFTPLTNPPQPSVPPFSPYHTNISQPESHQRVPLETPVPPQKAEKRWTPPGDVKPRPCDQCRQRKSGCVVQNGAPPCTICRHKNVACTYSVGPPRRHRRVDSDADQDGLNNQSANPPPPATDPPALSPPVTNQLSFHYYTPPGAMTQRTTYSVPVTPRAQHQSSHHPSQPEMPHPTIEADDRKRKRHPDAVQALESKASSPVSIRQPDTPSPAKKAALDPQYLPQSIVNVYEDYKWPVKLYQITKKANPNITAVGAPAAQTWMEGMIARGLATRPPGKLPQSRMFHYVARGFMKDGSLLRFLVLHNANNPWAGSYNYDTTTIGFYVQSHVDYNCITFKTYVPSLQKYIANLEKHGFLELVKQWNYNEPDARVKRFHKAYWLCANRAQLGNLLNWPRPKDDEEPAVEDPINNVGLEGAETVDVDEDKAREIWKHCLARAEKGRDDDPFPEYQVVSR